MPRFPRTFFLFFFISIGFCSNAQDTIRYQVTFPNAVQHECLISILLVGVDDTPLTFVMSSSSPGRYANHEFAKNVYDIHALSIEDDELPVVRTGPSEWTVIPTSGYLKLNYTLYANHPDGTYAGIDRTYAHLNIPASFMWIKGKEEKPIKIDFAFHESKSWKAATQLPKLKDNSYYSPNLYYFLDSPVILADFDSRSFVVNDNGTDKKINVVLNGPAPVAVKDQYTKMVEKVVAEQQAVFGELPNFDFGEYTFLCSYDNPYKGDGMEHRNSTMITSSQLLQGNEHTRISTVSHEFFHSWNIERIRPKSLEPFDFTQANQSDELWFGEGFTEYYGDLTLARAGIYDETDFFNIYTGKLNYVLNSPGTGKNSPVQMSQMAPFTDASSFIDETNFQNIFTSYYYYGAAIALALDLSLRSQFEGLSLDGYMALVWQRYGKTEIPYTVQDLKSALAQYTKNPNFSFAFFERYVEGRELPEFDLLLNKFGLKLEIQDTTETDLNKNYFKKVGEQLVHQYNPIERTTFYVAGLNRGDVLSSINDRSFTSVDELGEYFNSLKIGDLLRIKYIHLGKEFEKTTLVKPRRRYVLNFLYNQESTNSQQQKKLRDYWLGSKAKH